MFGELRGLRKGHRLDLTNDIIRVLTLSNRNDVSPDIVG